jgi:hypothetical protein
VPGGCAGEPDAVKADRDSTQGSRVAADRQGER